MTLSSEFKFDSAHRLIDYHGKCENLHGHTYRLRVTLAGTVSQKSGASGMVVDFGILKKIVRENVVDVLDHKLLNDIVEQPTAENLAIWVWDKLEPLLAGDNYLLSEIVLWETEDNFVTYTGAIE
jgi:6-pyruvoyltetrahydropterin/6-carboxytetrahydropterin synthase